MGKSLMFFKRLDESIKIKMSNTKLNLSGEQRDYST